MKVGELREALVKLQDMCVELKASAAAKDLENLNKLLSEFDGMTVSRFTNEVRRMRDGAGSKSSRARKSPETNVALAGEYASRLEQMRRTGGDFSAVLDELGTSKQIRLPELKEVSRQFIGAPSSARSKKAALKEIERFYLETRREQGVFGAIERMMGGAT